MFTALAIFAGIAALALFAMATHTYTITWTRGSETITSQVVYTADGEKNSDPVIPTGTTNQQVNLAWLVANLKSFMIVSDQVVTVKTNSSGSPQETLTLAAGNPITFRYNDGRAALFAGNVTALFITNTSGATANIQIRALEDVTP